MSTDSNGKKHWDKEVKIKVTSKSGDEERDINVYAQTREEAENGLQGSFAGKVKVVCKEPTHIKVCFVKVKIEKDEDQTNVGDSKNNDQYQSIQGTFDEKGQLRQFLSQAWIIPDIIDKDVCFEEDELNEFWAFDNNNSTETPSNKCLHRREDDLIEKFIEKFKLTNFTDGFKIFMVDENGLSGGAHINWSEYHSDININAFFKGYLIGYFDGKMNGYFDGAVINRYYRDHINCYFEGNIEGVLSGYTGTISYNSKEYYGIEGHAYQSEHSKHKDYNNKSAIIFRNNNKSTIAHELLHCLGLVHSFENNSKHTFKKYETPNIMDYSYNKYSLWHWQWKKMRGEEEKK